VGTSIQTLRRALADSSPRVTVRWTLVVSLPRRPTSLRAPLAPSSLTYRARSLVQVSACARTGIVTPHLPASHTVGWAHVTRMASPSLGCCAPLDVGLRISLRDRSARCKCHANKHRGFRYCCASTRTLPETIRVFGLRNELVHHLLTPHYFCLVCGME
jgi:hypothetical protein